MTEKRAHKRTPRFFAINIVAVDKDGRTVRFDGFKASPKFYDESGIDFSPEGVKIICSKTLPKESRIQMKMLIPDEENLNLIRANGTIKWFKEAKGKHKKYFMIGVHFKQIDPADRKKLMNLWRKYGSDK